MKSISIVIASMLGAASLALAVESVDISQLPAAIKRAVDKSSNGDAVKKVTIDNVNGRTVYVVEYERKNAPNPKVRIGEDGQVLRDTASTAVGAPDLPASLYSEYGGPVLPMTPKLELSNVPAPVQQTIKREAAGREIAAIHQDTIDGRNGYVAEFSEKGRNPRLYVAEDGSVLRPTEKPPALLVGTTFSDAPAPVQQSIRREVRTGEIVKIEKEGRRGEAHTYKVELRDARGSYHIRVSEDGRILENTRMNEQPATSG